MTERADIVERLARPEGTNADEWHLFLCTYLDNRATTAGDGLAFIAVQICEAIEEQTGRLRAVVRRALAAWECEEPLDVDEMRAAIALPKEPPT